MVLAATFLVPPATARAQFPGYGWGDGFAGYGFPGFGYGAYAGPYGLGMPGYGYGFGMPGYGFGLGYGFGVPGYGYALGGYGVPGIGIYYGYPAFGVEGSGSAIVNHPYLNPLFGVGMTPLGLQSYVTESNLLGRGQLAAAMRARARQQQGYGQR
jgi:hypothetical protein